MFVAAAILLALAAGDPSGAAQGDQKATDVGMRTATLIDHKPLDKAARGLSIMIRAQIDNPSSLFAPQVFARKTGQPRFQGFSMQESKHGRFTARLPASMLNDGSFEYFIESRSDDGSAARAGTPQQPFKVEAYDPPPTPVATTFTTDAPGAEVKVDNKVIGKTPMTASLDPGSHTVLITAADGRSIEQQLDIRSGGRKMTLNFPFSATAPSVPAAATADGSAPAAPTAPSTTSLTVVSDPSPAHVFIDGTKFGDTPYNGEIDPGQHLVGVDAEGRMHQERTVNAKPGRDVQLSFVLPALPKDPALSIDSDPVGAQVIIDDKERGRTPWVGPLSAGNHQVVLKLEGHRSVATSFVMPKDRDMSQRIILPVGSASGEPRLTISSLPSGATLLIDGKEVGLTPWSDDLKPGEHKLAVKMDGFKTEDRKVAVAAGRDADVNFSLVRLPGPGKLHIDTEPQNATISIDSKEVGKSPFNGEVEPGDHTIDVALDGYAAVQQAILVEAGQQVSLKLALQQAGAERLPPLIAVASDPQGAVLYVDGKVQGNTPVKVRSTPGPHDLKITLDGYVPRTGKVNLPDSKDFELRMAVSLKPTRGNTVQQSAPDPVDLARAQLKRAAACYRQGDWKCALAGYQAAFEFKPLPDLLYNIAQTRRRAGEYKEAAEAYRAFLKDAPASKMRSEAERFLAYCELELDPSKGKTSLSAGGPAVAGSRATAAGEVPTVAVSENGKSIEVGAVAAGASPTDGGTAAPTAAAPAQVAEDTDPPIVTHSPIARAIRGQPLRILARIVDEQSEVANAQACWKNLFKTEYSCAPMVKIGADQFGVEVPAKAVTDGFAYYIEAYDTSENGPARAGAPELPNTVIIEEPAPPKPVAPLVAEAAPAAAPANDLPPAPAEALGQNVQQKPGAQPEGDKNHLLRWIAIGGAAVTVGVGVGLEVHANGLINSVQDPNHPVSDPTGTLNQARTEQTIGYVLFGAASAFVIGAIAFWNTSL